MSDGIRDFEEIYTRYNRQVYLYLLSLSHDADTAEELTQQTFYKAFLHITKFRGDSGMGTWLTAIAKHEYYTYIKKRRRIVPFDDAMASETYEQSELDRNDLKGDVRRALAGFENETMKSVMIYRLFAGVPYRDIAEILKISESSAKVLYHRGREKLRKILREEYGYEI